MSAEQYFTAEPTSDGSDRHPVAFTLLERHFELVASGGVFSSTRLDLGTSVLLHRAVLPAPDTESALLDLGCGYGPISLVLASAAPKATVYAVDVNRRALELVRQNATANQVSVVAAMPDEVPDEVRFGQIWSNPPIRIGKAELHALLERWLPRLLPDGTAWLVVARHLGADSLQKWLIDGGWDVRRHASAKGYRVFQVKRTGVMPENA